MALKIILLFFITSFSVISNDEKINKINTEEKYIKLENKKILIGNTIEKKDNNKIENQQKTEKLKLQVNKEKLIKRLILLDYFTDSSITKYIDDKIAYNNLLYILENLINLKWKYIIDTKKNSKVRKITLEKLKLLSEEYYKKFWIKLKIVSAYRSYKYQKWIKDRGCPDLFCAKAWYSEHQSWLAIDFWETTEEKKYINNKKLKKYFDWMKINWPKYGFTNTYQKWKKIDWYAVEPWHWRYVWKDLSTYLYKNNLTFADFFYFEIKK